MKPTVMVSGGFDPLHFAHVRYLRAAAEHGEVVVALNSDAWIERKKGYAFMPWAERAEIMASQKHVALVVPVDDADGTVCSALRLFRPDVFAKGGDRGPENTPELKLCNQLAIKVLFGVGGGKLQSSSALVARATSHEPRAAARVTRAWGYYEVLHAAPGVKVKRLVIEPGKAISLQRHQLRSEHWILLGGALIRYDEDSAFAPDGEHIFVPIGTKHQVENPGGAPLEIIEVQRGECREGDIERFSEPRATSHEPR